MMGKEEEATVMKMVMVAAAQGPRSGRGSSRSSFKVEVLAMVEI
jgi:hypothetical protein